MNLIIIESPGKIITIQKFLDKNYKIVASTGHCYEIDPSENSIDIKNNFKPKYSLIKGKEKIIEELKKLSKKVDICYIATDPDREGEAIGWHIANSLDKKTNIKRIVFHEITKSAIQQAIKNPTTLNENLFNAQQARSVLDRLVGYKVSPFLWRYVASKTSAGRVQSIGLRIIVERQKEIDAFKIEEYWTIEGVFSKDKEKISSTFSKKLENETQTNETIEEIKKQKNWYIKSIEKTKKIRHPFPVFNTSSLQQFCSSTFGWPAKSTMSHAQALYEKGLITYHRTDSFNISKEALTSVREYIQSIGPKYLPDKPNFFKSKKSAQEAHEGIRPAHLENTPTEIKNSLTETESKLYEAIFRRFVASQMTDAIFNHTKIEIASENDLIFSATGQTLVFDGFLKVYIYSETSEVVFPQLKEKEKLKLEEVKGSQHFTKPPPQYNDASLVKTLEEKGIGRPSTYASIIETLKKRTYIEDNKKAFVPTELGKRVCDFLIKAFPELMDTNYTARIEEQLDEIADDKKNWQDVVEKFWVELEKRLKSTKEIGKQIKEQNITDIICPRCKKNPLVKRFGRFGAFYGCKGYASKECDAMFSIGQNGEPVVIVKKEKRYLESNCECGGRIVIRTSNKKGTEFGGCERFPKCRKIYSLNGELIERKKKND